MVASRLVLVWAVVLLVPSLGRCCEMEPRESYHLRHAEIVFISGSVNQLASTTLGEDAMLPLVLKSCSADKLAGNEGQATYMKKRKDIHLLTLSQWLSSKTY